MIPASVQPVIAGAVITAAATVGGIVGELSGDTHVSLGVVCTGGLLIGGLLWRWGRYTKGVEDQLKTLGEAVARIELRCVGGCKSNVSHE